MTVTITSKNNEKTFKDTDVINIGTAAQCNYKLNLGFDLIVTIQKGESGKRCFLCFQNNTRFELQDLEHIQDCFQYRKCL